ncbi:hypothetical protein PRZ61_14705 [Halomonas pacifica]|uniref:Outer membrane protein beta-barrel domain-containing protein n=1 Tax=Bisbaumannia pacifica TaxID=77098 RepID=A0A510X3C8_9GAMM|nr:porin family protein [Halomonas pacifica]MBH8580591.1 hypothetical protein [Halomonas pacifica]MDC8804701.1 hypothetical protein [Halomonas pacifica]GEK45916.1 hypothetical protein HPA02_01990 [Halomonas pacifica]
MSIPAHPFALLCLPLLLSLPLAATAAQEADEASLQLDNGMQVDGEEIDFYDGFTSGFRVAAAYLIPRLPRFEIGAEFAYLESEQLPTTYQGMPVQLDSTSLRGAVMAGFRLGQLSLYGKTGLAGWQADMAGHLGGDWQQDSLNGTAQTFGLGASVQHNAWQGRLEYEYIDADRLDHLNITSARLSYRF